MGKEIENLMDKVFNFLMNSEEFVEQSGSREFLVSTQGKTCSIKFGKC